MPDVIPLAVEGRRAPKPPWLKVRAPGSPSYLRLKGLMRELQLHTVCEEARCPNIGECWEHKAATFMILGDVCTRNCAYCAVSHGTPKAFDPTEPAKLAAIKGALHTRFEEYQATMEEAVELDQASNAVIDLIDAGRLDDAEHAARELLERYPEVHDGHDRLGMVYEARGLPRAAAECYRQVLAFIRAHPDHYEPAMETTFIELIAKLDPPPAG